jgi:hypothetical protein
MRSGWNKSVSRVECVKRKEEEGEKRESMWC